MPNEPTQALSCPTNSVTASLRRPTRQNLEIDTYVTLPGKDALSDHTYNPLTWWSGMEGLPKMQSLVRRLWSIPAASAAAERVFSNSKATVSPDKPSIGSETAMQRCFISVNFHLLGDQLIPPC